jgi:hypothetical protein
MNLKDIINGYNYNDSFITLFGKDNLGLYNKGNLSSHIFWYIGTVIFSIIFYIIEKQNYRRNYGKLPEISKEEEEKKLNDKELLEGKIVYLHYERKKNFIFSKNTFYFFLVLIILWILEEHLIEIFVCLKDLDFWAMEIIITSYLNSKMFNLEIYRHHKLVYFINIIPIILKISTIVLSFIDVGNHNYNEINYEYCYNNTDNLCKGVEKGRLKNLYVIHWWLVIVGIIAYLFLITLRAYVNSNLKWFMDLKYMSPNKILMIYGFLGAILCSIACTFTTLVKCEETKSNNKDLFDYICVVNDTIINNTNNDTTHLKYFDNFYIYFQNIDFFEILNIIFFFLNKYFSILIIKFFTPVHLILSIPAYYIIQKIVLIINTLIREHSFFNKKIFIYKTEKFILDSSGDFVSFVGLFIYLEIIELNFCKLNYNLRTNIITRGSNDLYKYIETDESESIDDASIGRNSQI